MKSFDEDFLIRENHPGEIIYIMHSFLLAIDVITRNIGIVEALLVQDGLG